MTPSARFVPLATFPNGFDADLVRERLEAEGIPVLVRGPFVGMFGGAYQGMTVGGVSLLVPSPELDRARELLDD